MSEAIESFSEGGDAILKLLLDGNEAPLLQNWAMVVSSLKME